MTFEELKENGARVARDAEDAQQQIRGLMGDPRFAALLGWLELRGYQYVEAGSDQKMAEHTHATAHCMGSVFAYRQILAELRHLWDTKPKERGGQRRD